jgi:hypothetical protein
MFGVRSEGFSEMRGAPGPTLEDGDGVRRLSTGDAAEN